MAAHDKQSSTQAAGKGWQTPAVILALAAGVVGLTVYVANRPPDRPPPAPAKPRQSLAEEVLAKVRPLLQGPIADAETIRVARDLMRAYVRGEPADVEVRPLLAQAYYRLGQIEQAKRTAAEVLRIAPRSPDMLALQGVIALRQNESGYLELFRLAIDASDRPAKLAGTLGCELMAVGKTQVAEEFLQKAYAGGQRDAMTLWALGELAVRAKDYARAKPLLEEAARQDKSDPRILMLLAETLKNLGELDAAVAAVEAALPSAPEKGPLQMELGEIRLLKKDRLGAAEAFAQAAAYAPLRGQAALRAAQAYYLAGKYALAMEFIDIAAAINPSEDVVKWKTKIEEARFPQPTGKN